MYPLHPSWRKLVLCGGGAWVSVFVFRQHMFNGLALPPITGGGLRVRHSHGTDTFFPQKLRWRTVVFRSPLTSLMVDYLPMSLFSGNDLCWCSFGGGLLCFNHTDPSFRSLLFVAISISLR